MVFQTWNLLMREKYLREAEVTCFLPIVSILVAIYCLSDRMATGITLHMINKQVLVVCNALP